MNDTLSRRLTETYPLLYSSHATCDDGNGNAFFYFECGDGWFALLDELSGKLERVARIQIDTNEIDPYGHIKAAQVKSKFGMLRFYADNTTEAARDMILDAEAKSANTCEGCGVLSVAIPMNGWISNYCEECRKQ